MGSEPGFTNIVPQGRLKVVQDCIAAYFQLSSARAVQISETLGFLTE
jgi:hypothetical protein